MYEKNTPPGIPVLEVKNSPRLCKNSRNLRLHSPSVWGAGGQEWEGRQTSVGAWRQRQVGLSAEAAGCWQILLVTEAAYTTTALHFPGLPSASWNRIFRESNV